MEMKKLNTDALQALTKAGADQAETVLTIAEKTEMNLENGEQKLVRTTVDHHWRLTALRGQQQGSISLNQVNAGALETAVTEVMTIAAASAPDPAHDIAPYQPAKVFRKGETKPNLALMFQRLKTFTQEVAAVFPRIILLSAQLDFTKTTRYFQNSNGVDFTTEEGVYNFSVTFSAKEGASSSSFNYSGFSTLHLEKELLEGGSLRTLLRQAEAGLSPEKAPGKFEGTVIIAPDCLEGFLHSFLGITITDGPLITGASLFKDKLNQPVASPLLTLVSQPLGPEIIDGYFLTGDGYEAQNATIIEDGILKTYLLSLYGANKTGLPRGVNDGGSFVVQPGQQSLAEIVQGVKKGILLTRFSGGNPSLNGDFSGIAKNSFYVADGAIQYPLKETMIAGNLISLFREITAVSRERVDFGFALLPWVASQGVTIAAQ
ncbi:MAG TPA: TldD/PmbA family protein [Capillibacterium sp.]